ncbi:MAG: oligosaccharide flippase family protein [Proteobacteria bacterium]|nr:oligosaccharide flippase family protein [Pseudomonadota bacterium]
MQNVAIIATGTAGAQAITMIFAPIITRLYGPEAFGLQGTFVALVAVLTPIAALSYPIAIVLPKEDNDAKGIAQLSTYISLTISVLVMLAIIVGGDRILALLGIEALTALVLLIPLNMLFSSWLQIAQQWLIRKKQFRITAKLAVVQALIVNCAKAGIGWFNPLGSVLIILFTFGSAFHAAMLYMAARQTGMSGGQTPQAQTRTPLLELARRHSDFPVYRAPQVFINAISQSLPVLMLAAFFGPASAGFYALGKGVLGMPTQLIGQSVADVFYPRIAEAAHKDENLTRLIIKATLALAAVGFFPSAIIVAFGPGLFGFVFGAKWIVAGEYAQWIALMSFFNFINRPAVAAVPVLDLQRGLMIYELFSTGLKLVALYIGFYVVRSDTVAVAFFSIFGALAYIVLILWVIMSSKR